MTGLKENLIKLVCAIVFFALILFGLSFLQTPKGVPQDSEELDTSEAVVQEAEGKSFAIPSEEMVYGFSIGTLHKAYPLSAFEDKDVIYDVILGEPVIIGPSYAGDGVIMTHAETGEVFRPIRVQWGTWYASFPDTLIFSEE